MIQAPTLPTISQPQFQEMTELSSWLDDIFTGDTSSSNGVACNDTSSPLLKATQSLPDIPVLPIHTNSDDHLSKGSDWLDTEIEAILSSPANSDAEHIIHHPVSPSVSPYSAKSTFQTPEPMPSALSIDQQASSPISRKTLSQKASLISDGSDNEDITARPAKRARSSTASSVVNGPDEVASAFVPKLDSKSIVVQKQNPIAKKPKSKDIVTKKTVRREKNREHAKKSRSKKRDFNVALEESALALREENKKLRRLVYANFGEHKAKAMVKERIRTPEDKMIEALKKPSNKVLSKSVVHYLESLRCDITLHAKK